MPRHKHTALYIGALLLLLLLFLICFLKSVKPAYVFDTHEHVQSLAEAQALLTADNAAGIRKTILLPTPIETFTLNGSKTFTGYKENTDVLFQIAQKYPDRFIPFCTISPLDPNALGYLKDCVKKGGKGLKLYNGHTYYHEIFGQPLDSPTMMPIYAFAEKNKLPVIYHVNIANYGNELENVLSQFPKLFVLVPHFMISSADLDKVTFLLDKYPNLYTDIGFGSTEFLAAGFRRVNSDPAKFVNFFNKYQDRIMFGTDMVLADKDEMDPSNIEEVLNCYKDMLSKMRFTCDVVTNYYQQTLDEAKRALDSCTSKNSEYCQSLQQNADVCRQRFDDVAGLSGLALDDKVLSKIFWENANRFLTPT